MLPPPLKRHLLPLALALSAGAVLAQSAADTGAPASVQRTTVEQDNLWDIAGQQAPVLGATRQQYMVAVLRRNPDAFVKGNIHRLRKGVPLTLPGRDAVLAEDRAVSIVLVAEHLKAMRGAGVLAPLTPPAVAEHPATPASVPAPAPASVPASAPGPAPVVPAPAPAASVATPPVLPAEVPASASVVEPIASAAVEMSTEAASAALEGGSVPRMLPWLLALGGLAGGVILWRRRRAGFQPDAVPQDFSHTLSATRTGGPRVFDISNAAAEMARSVETSHAATQLVRKEGEDDDAFDVVRLTEQAAIKLEIARASLEVGRTDHARALLQAVLREGSGRHAAEAAEILARMG